MGNIVSKIFTSGETHQNDSDPKVEHILDKSPDCHVTCTRRDFVKLCSENVSISIEKNKMEHFNDFAQAGDFIVC